MEPILEEDKFQQFVFPDKSRAKAKEDAKQQRNSEAAVVVGHGAAPRTATVEPGPAGPRVDQQLAFKQDDSNENTDVEKGGAMASFCRRLACHVGQYSEIGQGVLCAAAGPKPLLCVLGCLDAGQLRAAALRLCWTPTKVFGAPGPRCMNVALSPPVLAVFTTHLTKLYM